MTTSTHRRKYRSRRRGKADEKSHPPKSPQAWLIALVIGLALLAALAIPLSAAPQDRVPLMMYEVVIVGLAFLLIGAITAVEKEAIAIDDALYYRRRGWLFRRRKVGKVALQAVYLLVVLFGLGRAIFQPRHTWPAILWIGAGCAVVAVGIGLLMLWE